jgi:hypothetical protein
MVGRAADLKEEVKRWSVKGIALVGTNVEHELVSV